MLDEIADLNQKVKKLMKEKDEIMAMKVSKLGLKPEDEGEVLELDEDAETSDGDIRFPKLAQIDERYKALAEAEYHALFEAAVTIPWQTTTSINPVVSNAIPYQKGKAAYGLTSDKLKNIIVLAEAITQEVRAQVVALYEEDK